MNFTSEYFGENSYLCNKFTRKVNVTSFNIQTVRVNSEPLDFWEEKCHIKSKMIRYHFYDFHWNFLFLPGWKQLKQWVFMMGGRIKSNEPISEEIYNAFETFAIDPIFMHFLWTLSFWALFANWSYIHILN